MVTGPCPGVKLLFSVQPSVVPGVCHLCRLFISGAMLADLQGIQDACGVVKMSLGVYMLFNYYPLDSESGLLLGPGQVPQLLQLNWFSQQVMRIQNVSKHCK